MADVNNKLRLQIVTQLDAAGIKATKDQVDALELGLRRAGNSGQEAGSKFGKLEKALGSLPGPIGKIGGALGGLAGTATLVFGAFSLGVEIGNKIVDLAKKWGLMADPIADLKKENAAYNQELANLEESLKRVAEAEEKRNKAARKDLDDQIKKIDDQTAAYFRQASAVEGLRKAQGDAEMMQLERRKFEEMKAYSDAGYTEAAEQIGKYYDVLEAELKAKREIEAFDRGSLKITKELSSAEEKYATAVSAVEKAREARDNAAIALDKHRNKTALIKDGDNVWFGNDGDAKKDTNLEKALRDCEAVLADAEKVMAKQSERLENVDAEVLTRQMERANLAASGALSVDRAAQAYDNFVVSANNPLNAVIDESWAKDLLRASTEANTNQVEMLEIVRGMADNLERVLTGGAD